jgi:hypothetical protein
VNDLSCFGLVKKFDILGYYIIDCSSYTFVFNIFGVFTFASIDIVFIDPGVLNSLLSGDLKKFTYTSLKHGDSYEASLVFLTIDITDCPLTAIPILTGKLFSSYDDWLILTLPLLYCYILPYGLLVLILAAFYADNF